MTSPQLVHNKIFLKKITKKLIANIISLRFFCLNSSFLQRLTVPRIIDQFRRKRYQKKRKYVGYKFLHEFFQKYFVVHYRWPAKDSFSTYVCTEEIYSCCAYCRWANQSISEETIKTDCGGNNRSFLIQRFQMKLNEWSYDNFKDF